MTLRGAKPACVRRTNSSIFLLVGVKYVPDVSLGIEDIGAWIFFLSAHPADNLIEVVRQVEPSPEIWVVTATEAYEMILICLRHGCLHLYVLREVTFSLRRSCLRYVARNARHIKAR